MGNSRPPSLFQEVDYPQFLENFLLKRRGKSILNYKETQPSIDFKVKWLLLIVRIHVDLMGICSNSHKHENNQDKKNPKRCESTMTNACLISSLKTKHKNQRQEHKMCKM